MKHLLAASLASVALVAGASQFTPSALADDKPSQVSTDGTGLKVGETITDAELQTGELKTVSLLELAKEEGPLVVTFYRGGWCPFCNTALKDWQSKLEDIEHLGAKFVAITPEKPELSLDTAKKNDLSYLVLSDSENEAAKALNVLFTVDEKTKKKYEDSYGIYLGEFNASGQWKLPHPATFIIDTQGVVRYAHVDPDYRKGRANPAEVIHALKQLQ